MKSGTSKYQLWYTRRGEVVRGPFPPGQIRRYLILGRIVDTDELSVDQINWNPVRDHEDLYPEELTADLNDPAARERLRLARVREDERIRQRRNEPRYDVGPEEELRRPAAGDRRQPEDVFTLSSREHRKRIIEHEPATNHRHRNVALAVTGVFIGVFLLAILITPESESYSFHCLKTAVPGVNWSNCTKQAMDLRGLDLRRSQIVNAFLDKSELSNSDFSHSRLDYTNFSQTTMLRARFDNAQLKGAVFRGAHLKDTSMKSVKMSFVILQEAVLNNVNLENADLESADLTGATLQDVNLQGVNLTNAIWVDGTLCGPGSIGECVPEL